MLKKYNIQKTNDKQFKKISIVGKKSTTQSKSIH